MPTIEVQLRRVSVVSSRPFEEIVRSLTATLGHPDMNAFHKAVAAATTVADLEDLVQGRSVRREVLFIPAGASDAKALRGKIVLTVDASQ